MTAKCQTRLSNAIVGKVPAYPLRRLPAPAIVVFAGDSFAIASYPRCSMVGFPTIFARFIAGAFVAERMAASLRGGNC
jgi:hypothetical protein